MLEDADKPQLIKQNCAKMGIDCLVCIGGNGQDSFNRQLAQARNGYRTDGSSCRLDNALCRRCRRRRRYSYPRNRILNKVNEVLLDRAHRGKPYSIVVVGEGIKTSKKDTVSAGAWIAEQIEKGTKIETRVTVPGYTLRGGSPSPLDRIIATRMGTYAASLIHKEQFGTMVAIHNNEMKSVSLKEVGGKTRLVPQDHFLIKQAKRVGTFFGT